MRRGVRAILDGNAPKPWSIERFNDRRKPRQPRRCRSCGATPASDRSRYCGPCREDRYKEQEERARLRRNARRKQLRRRYLYSKASDTAAERAGLMTRAEALAIYERIKADRLAREARGAA